MTLSRREGVDIRPTLLRVLTDLYVQASAHSGDEERQFVELTSRLIDQVDDATRAAVRARLAIYPGTPAEVMKKLGLKPASPDAHVPLARAVRTGLHIEVGQDPQQGRTNVDAFPAGQRHQSVKAWKHWRGGHVWNTRRSNARTSLGRLF